MILLSLSPLAAVAVIAVAVTAGPDERDACKLAIEQYRKVKAEVEAATHVFAECFAQPRISSCTLEFDELAVLQDRLETAVADYRDACP